MQDKQRFATTGSAYDLPEPHFDEELTLVTRGTAAGELLRRYWQPVAKSDKVKDLPVKIRILGEDLVLFRKPNGSVGLVYPRCIHRGSDLMYGKVTDKGIRCCYHGWTFETDGRCTDQPGIRNPSTHLRQPWYPTEERYGLIFAYLGPIDRKPPLPHYDLLEQLPPDWHVLADDTTIPSGGAGNMPCNWLQHHENGLDPAHVPIVHAAQFPEIMTTNDGKYEFERRVDRIFSQGTMQAGGVSLNFKVELIMPNIRVIPDPLLSADRPDGKSDSVAWTVPIDNENTIVFTAFAVSQGTVPSGDLPLYDGKRWSELSFEQHQRFPGDYEAQTGQGVIAFHSEEHLVRMDEGVVLYRRLLRDAIKSVAEGRDPPLAFGSASLYIDTSAGVTITPISPVQQTVQSVSYAPASSSVRGKWNIIIKTPLGDKPGILDLETDGTSLSGTLTDADNTSIIADGKVDGMKLQWTSKLSKPMPMSLTFTAAVDGNRISGAARHMLGSAAFRGTRD